MHVAIGGDSDWLCRERFGSRLIRSHDRSRLRRGIRHGRQFIGYQLPVVVDLLSLETGARCRGIDVFPHRIAGSDPCAVWITGSIPLPVVGRGIQFFSRTIRHIFVEATLGSRDRDAPRLNGHHPVSWRAYISLQRSVALQQKGRAVSDLRGRRVYTKIPYCGRYEIRALREERSEIECLVAPVRQVAAGWPVSHSMAIYVEDEPVVRAHMDDIAGRLAPELQPAAKMQDDRLPQGSSGMGYPTRLPLRLRGQHSYGKCDSEHKQNQGAC